VSEHNQRYNSACRLIQESYW